VNKQTAAGVLFALVLGGGAGYWIAGYLGNKDTVPAGDTGMKPGEPEVLFYRNPMNPEITSPVPATDEMGMDYIPVYAEKEKPKRAPELLFYRNPMNPEITSPVPAQDEMGMDYIPVYADDEGQSSDEPTGTVKIDPVTVQNIGVRTAVAERQSLSRHIRSVGRVAFDEERLARLHPKTEGWIQELYIDKTGEQIAKDAILLNIYSPQLVTSQQEYLLALNNLDVLRKSPYEEIRQGAEELASSARERLEMLDVPEHQIHELERSREIKKYLHIHSPFDGVIIHIGAREGQYVTPSTELYKIADLSRVWVFADVYENEVSWIQVNDPVDMKLAAIPGKVFTGRVGYIYPYAEAKTRTIKVRMEFENPDLLLKPDMFADITIHAQRKVDAIVIPAEAVVRSGERDQVFVVREPGKFEPREVRLGLSSNGMVQVIDGIPAGEEVVTSSQFLIDSESKLREATAKMLEATPSKQGRGSDQGDH
jgi:Cu(I)/Ag(I) efflux system membrane fusion protein